MPFFCVFNLMTSHQSRSMVWSHEKFQNEIQSKLSKDQIHNPQKIKLPPYYPDTPIVRKTVARFHDCVTAMDQEGEILKQLQEDGLAENTIVFFFSDHGSGMPRHKRALLDSGMHVPLLVRLPKKWQHFAQVKPGQTTDRLVSFVDFGPTCSILQALQSHPTCRADHFLEKIPKRKENMFTGTATGWMRCGILPVRSGIKNTSTSGTTCPILDIISQPHGRISEKLGMNSTN